MTYYTKYSKYSIYGNCRLLSFFMVLSLFFLLVNLFLVFRLTCVDMEPLPFSPVFRIRIAGLNTRIRPTGPGSRAHSKIAAIDFSFLNICRLKKFNKIKSFDRWLPPASIKRIRGNFYFGAFSISLFWTEGKSAKN